MQIFDYFVAQWWKSRLQSLVQKSCPFSGKKSSGSPFMVNIRLNPSHLTFNHYSRTVLKLQHVLPYFVVSCHCSLNPALWLVPVSFLLSHHCVTKFFVPELAQKSLMIIWNDPKIISVNDKAELCCYLGFLENKRNSGDVRDNLKPKEWDDPKLTCTLLGAWTLQDPSFGRGHYEECPLCQGPEFRKLNHEGLSFREPITGRGSFTWVTCDLCWFSPPCSFCDDSNFKNQKSKWVKFHLENYNWPPL